MEKLTVSGPLICPSTINYVFKRLADSFPNKHTSKYKENQPRGGRGGRREGEGEDAFGKQEGVKDPNGPLGGRGEGKESRNDILC